MKGQPPTDQSDKQAAQEEEGFDRLVRDNIGWMLFLAARILNDGTKAEDAVQNAFSNIHKGLENFENRANLKTWMHRIVVNEALMLLRKDRQLKELPIDDSYPLFDQNGCRVVDQAVTWETAEMNLTAQQTREIVRDEIAKLPDDLRIVLILRDIEGVSTAEVGKLLELNEPTVRVRLHRARVALKKRLEPLIVRGEL
ncbi:sigma-70 family RNA polymerase sigma factor [uncultured Tateyamaria sp.]|uniref:RNA polymerase sigma factor n=1 Tax=uncultured Tateyamaria sp. TaxID=455651 RepID=UPI00262A718B|nr:sigma-70 family RNA polymerase sigma factor [uncultured Tateyamaria sp.]